MRSFPLANHSTRIMACGSYPPCAVRSCWLGCFSRIAARVCLTSRPCRYQVVNVISVQPVLHGNRISGIPESGPKNIPRVPKKRKPQKPRILGSAKIPFHIIYIFAAFAENAQTKRPADRDREFLRRLFEKDAHTRAHVLTLYYVVSIFSSTYYLI